MALTVHEESVVVEEIKEVELRSHHVQFTTEIIMNWVTATGSCTQQTSSKEVKMSVTQKEKSKGICMEGYPEKCHFLLLYSSPFTINRPPLHQNVHSHSILLCLNWLMFCHFAGNL